MQDRRQPARIRDVESHGFAGLQGRAENRHLSLVFADCNLYCTTSVSFYQL